MNHSIGGRKALVSTGVSYFVLYQTSDAAHLPPHTAREKVNKKCQDRAKDPTYSIEFSAVIYLFSRRRKVDLLSVSIYALDLSHSFYSAFIP